MFWTSGHPYHRGYDLLQDTSRIAKGAQQWMSLHHYRQFLENNEGKNAKACLTHLKQKGYRIISTLPLPDALPIDQVPIDKPLAFFFGTEKEGLSKHIQSHTDISMTIPMVGCTESLNVSVAAGIVMQYFTRKIRAEEDIDWGLTHHEKLELRTKWYLDALSKVDTHLRHFRNIHKGNSY